jgi:hypothetical protein
MNPFYGMIAVLLLAGCSSSEDTTEVVVDTNYPIHPIVRLAEREPSRAILNDNSEFDTSVFRVDAKGAGYPDNYTNVLPLPAAVNTEGVLTFDTPQYYQTNGDNTALLGVHPAVGNGWDPSAQEVTYTIDGKTDIMATDFVAASKMDAQPALTYRHILTLINVRVYAQDKATIDRWGDVISIAVIGQPECTLTLPAPGAIGSVVAAFSGTPIDLLLTDVDGSVPSVLKVAATEKDKAQPFGFCLFAPASDYALTLKVVTSLGATNNVTLPATTFEAGKAYDVTLEMKSTELNGTVEITSWEKGTPSEPVDGDLI